MIKYVYVLTTIKIVRTSSKEAMSYFCLLFKVKKLNWLSAGKLCRREIRNEIFLAFSQSATSRASETSYELSAASLETKGIRHREWQVVLVVRSGSAICIISAHTL